MRSKKIAMLVILFLTFLAAGCKVPEKTIEDNPAVSTGDIKLHTSRHEAAKVAIKLVQAMKENNCREIVRGNIDDRREIMKLKLNTPNSRWDEVENIIVQEKKVLCNAVSKALQHTSFRVKEKVLEHKIEMRDEQGAIIGETKEFIVFGVVEHFLRENSFYTVTQDGLVRFRTIRITFIRMEGDLVSTGIAHLREFDEPWPNDEKTRIVLAQRHFDEGNLSRALELLGEVETPMGKKWRANLLYRKSSQHLFTYRSGTPSRSEMREALELDPSLKPLLKRDACIYLKQGRRIALDVLQEFLPGETCE